MDSLFVEILAATVFFWSLQVCSGSEAACSEHLALAGTNDELSLLQVQRSVMQHRAGLSRKLPMNNERTLDTTLEAKKAFVFDFDETLSKVHMWRELSKFDANDEPSNLANHPDAVNYVKNKVFGGDEHIQAMAKAFSVAIKNDWQLWILSNGVKAEIDQALDIAGLRQYFTSDDGREDRVIAASRDRNNGGINDYNYAGEHGKAVHIQKHIKVGKIKFVVLFDDDESNVNECSKEMQVGEFIKPDDTCVGLYFPDGVGPLDIENLSGWKTSDPRWQDIKSTEENPKHLSCTPCLPPIRNGESGGNPRDEEDKDNGCRCW